MFVAGVVIGTWYVAILGIMLRRTANAAQHGIGPAITVAVVGIATITACAMRLLARVQPNDVDRGGDVACHARPEALK